MRRTLSGSPVVWNTGGGQIQPPGCRLLSPDRETALHLPAPKTLPSGSGLFQHLHESACTITSLRKVQVSKDHTCPCIHVDSEKRHLSISGAFFQVDLFQLQESSLVIRLDLFLLSFQFIPLFLLPFDPFLT